MSAEMGFGCGDIGLAWRDTEGSDFVILIGGGILPPEAEVIVKSVVGVSHGIRARSEKRNARMACSGRLSDPVNGMEMMRRIAAMGVNHQLKQTMAMMEVFTVPRRKPKGSWRWDRVAE